MKKKLLVAAGVSMLAIFTSTSLATNTWAGGKAADDVDLWQLVSERLGDPEYYDSEIDGAFELEDWASLDERVADEFGISLSASGGSGGGAAPLTGACSTSGGQITCTVTTSNRYVRVGKKASSDTIIICESTDDVNFTLTGSQTRTTETSLQVIGTTGVDRISIVNTASSPTGCSFDDFPTWFTTEILVNGMDSYDWVYGSNYADFLIGEYVRGYDGNDHIHIGTNEAATEYAWGGNGADNIEGVAGTQKLYGEAGNDYLIGYQGDDYLVGGSGNDRIYGDTTTCDDYADKDTLLGGAGDDVLWGQCGDDKLDGQGGTGDWCHGGSNLTGGPGGYIGDGCDMDYDCENYDGCEYQWDGDA